MLPVGFLNDAPPTPAPRKSRTIKPVTIQLDREPRDTRKEETMKSDSEDDSVLGLVIS